MLPSTVANDESVLSSILKAIKDFIETPLLFKKVCAVYNMEKKKEEKIEKNTETNPGLNQG